jgi:uncharacterized protein involved in exopolysaccharide biosynthesis
MNPRYRQAFRRHRILYSLPIVLVTLIATWYVLGAPKAYQSGASLWVDTPAPEQSSLSQTNTFVLTPAAQAQQLLNELLTTRDFRLEIGHRGPLSKYYATNPSLGWAPSAFLAKLKSRQSGANEVVAALDAKHVLTSVAGPQVLAVSVKEPSPELAQGTLGALIKAFNEQRSAFTVQRAQATLAYYKNQATAAAQTLANTKSAITSFVASNPGAGGTSQTAADAQLRSLQQAERVAASRYSAANKAANQAAVTLEATLTDKTSFRVLDAPVLPTGPVSGKKKQLMAIIGGLFAGALLAFLALVMFSKPEGPDDGERAYESEPVHLRRDGGNVFAPAATAATTASADAPTPEAAGGSA